MERGTPKGFVLRFEWLDAISEEPPEIISAFVTLIAEFARTGVRYPAKKIPVQIRVLYSLAASEIGRDFDLYEEKRSRARDMAAKRWKQKAPRATHARKSDDEDDEDAGSASAPSGDFVHSAETGHASIPANSADTGVLMNKVSAVSREDNKRLISQPEAQSSRVPESAQNDVPDTHNQEGMPTHAYACLSMPTHACACLSMPTHKIDANNNLNPNPNPNNNLNNNLNTNNARARAELSLCWESTSQCFRDWWRAYPRTGINAGRRVKMAECWRMWQEKGLDSIAGTVMSATKYWAQVADNDAKRGAIHGIVATTTFLRQEKWAELDEVALESVAATGDKPAREAELPDPYDSREIREAKEVERVSAMESLRARKYADSDEVERRVKQMERARAEGRAVLPVSLPCAAEGCPHTVEVNSLAELKAFRTGRNLCGHCIRQRIDALPDEIQATIDELTNKHMKALVDGDETCAALLRDSIGRITDKFVFGLEGGDRVSNR